MGTRILVDRLWPRGVKKATATADEWLKGLTPSPELRKDWGHDPARFSEFADRYRSELDERLDSYKDATESGGDGDSSGSDSDSEAAQVGGYASGQRRAKTSSWSLRRKIVCLIMPSF